MGRKEDMLYRKIMSNVSRQLNRIINEAENDDVKTEVQKAADAFEKDIKSTKSNLGDAIQMLKIISKGKEKQFKYKDIPYSELIPELQKRVNGNKTVNERTRRLRKR